MSENKMVFKGFSEELFRFLKDLEKNNTVEWFRNNRQRYEEYLVEPSRAYVTEVAPFLNRINPAIRTEPKFNQTLMRLNKDMRFAKGSPYKNYFLIHFGRFKLDSEFFLYFEPNQTDLGIFINNTDGDQLYFKQNYIRYKKEIVEIFNRNKLNNKVYLQQMDNKRPETVLKKFDANKHIEKLGNYKYILIQLTNFTQQKVYSDNLLPLSIETFTKLYPLLCFSYSQIR
ncbi:MAG: DUF2461 family protein [Melioribacteraceae bacterium]|nr:DUF2461 family protein [Melioribacteraceae bacterium]